jgi:RNA polymerase sigma-70 factor, ECF subfamily
VVKDAFSGNPAVCLPLTEEARALEMSILSPLPATSSNSLESCVELVAGGSELAIQTPLQAYDCYFEVVWRNLRRLGVPESLVEDAVQDVFLVVHRRWSEFEHRSTRRTWILGIALRVAKDYRRRRVRGMPTNPEDVEILTSRDCPEDNAANRQVAELLSNILERLDDEHRAILVMVELEELSVADAASAIGIPTSTAYKRLHKAHRTFEQAYQRLMAGERWRSRWHP